MKRVSKKYELGTDIQGVNPGDTIVPKKIIVPKKFNTGNLVKDNLLRLQDSMKQVAKQPKVYVKPKTDIKTATPEQRAAQELVKQQNRAKLEADFAKGAAIRGLTPAQYSLWLKRNSRKSDVQLDGLCAPGSSENKGSCAPGVNEKKAAASQGVDYALGSGVAGVSIKDYMETPYETMTRNDIAKAKAEAAALSDPLASGIEIGTQLLATMANAKGTSMRTAPQTEALDNQITPVGLVPMKAGNMLPTAKSYKGAYGAKVKGDIEIEGGEVVQTPNGEVVEMQGPSHEQGGIDMNITDPNGAITSTQIPENSQVIPKRIIGADGRSLADRAKSRAIKEKNIDKILDKNKTDIAVKNAANRRKSYLKKEADEDMFLQTMVQQMMQGGQPQEEIQQYGDLGINSVGDETPQEKLARLNKEIERHFGNGDLNTSNYKGIDLSQYGVANNTPLQTLPNDGTIGIKKSSFFDPTDLTSHMTPAMPAFDTSIEALSKGITSSGFENGYNAADEFAKKHQTPEIPTDFMQPDAEQKTFDPGYLPKIGDLFGLYGNYKSGKDALANTAEERAGDTANVNMYRDFGKRSLEKFSQSEEYLGLLKDEALKRSAANAAALKKSGRNLRGIQQVQGAEFVANQNQNQAEGDIYAQNAAQMMQLMGQEAQFMGHQDQVVMGGEQARDLADRQDRSAYYTNRAQDLQTRATGLQQTGKDLNQIAMNPQMMALLKDFGKYFSVDSSGKLIAKAKV